MKDITGRSSVLYGTGSRRYTPGAQVFHWVTMILIFAIVPLGWIFAEFKTKGNPPTSFEAPLPGAPGDYASLHKTLGLIVLAIVVVRIVYRLLNAPPALPGSMAVWQRGLSLATHWAIYAVIIVMPVSGYIMSSASTHPISVFGLFDFPKLPIDKDTGKIANEIHIVVQYAVYALVLLHVAAVGWHLFVRRDGILDRMLPRQANVE